VASMEKEVDRCGKRYRELVRQRKLIFERLDDLKQEMESCEKRARYIREQLEDAKQQGERIKIMAKVEKPVGKKYIILAEVESENTPGKKYEIRLGGDSRVYCTCPAWRFRGGNCKHLTRYREELVQS